MQGATQFSLFHERGETTRANVVYPGGITVTRTICNEGKILTQRPSGTIVAPRRKISWRHLRPDFSNSCPP